MTGDLCILLLIAAGLFAATRLGRVRGRFVRGRRLAPEEGSTRWRAGNAERSEGLSWGGRALPPGAETAHFLVIGTTGSGKTLTIGSLMARALPGIEPGSDSRAILFDAKQEVMSLLGAIGLRCPVYNLNPFDARSVAWDIARDVTSPASILQVAAAFIPEESGANRYFSDAARTLLAGVMQGLADSLPGTWTLADVARAVRDRESLERVLAAGHGGAQLLGLYFREERTLANIVSTLHSRLAPLEPIAALWERSSARLSLTEWVRGEAILVLGADETVRVPLQAVNRVIFKRVSELVLAEAESKTRRTWVFLDEAREAGKLDGLSSLLTRGRSKGACVVLGFQDIAGLTEVYGEHQASELTGMCSNKAFLRLESAETAGWAARCIGQYESVQVQRSSSCGAGLARSRARSEQRLTADAVLPAELLALPPTTAEGGVAGYFLSPFVGAYAARVPLAALTAGLPDAAERATPNFVPRDEGEQRLELAPEAAAGGGAEEDATGGASRPREGRLRLVKRAR